MDSREEKLAESGREKLKTQEQSAVEVTPERKEATAPELTKLFHTLERNPGVIEKLALGPITRVLEKVDDGKRKGRSVEITEWEWDREKHDVNCTSTIILGNFDFPDTGPAAMKDGRVQEHTTKEYSGSGDKQRPLMMLSTQIARREGRPMQRFKLSLVDPKTGEEYSCSHGYPLVGPNTTRLNTWTINGKPADSSKVSREIKNLLDLSRDPRKFDIMAPFWAGHGAVNAQDMESKDDWSFIPPREK